MVFFNGTATTEIYTLTLRDALPIYRELPQVARAGGPPGRRPSVGERREQHRDQQADDPDHDQQLDEREPGTEARERKSTRLNSSHANISHAAFCLKKNRSLLQT